MKSLITIGTLLILSFCLTSCYSSRTLVDDDVYVVKNSLLPTEESLNDETSYSSFRYKKNKNDVSDDYYLNDDNLIYNGNYFGNYYFFQRPYNYNCYSHSLYYGNGYYNAFGNGFYDPFTGQYYQNLNYSPYCYFGSQYLPEYYGFAGYGYGISTVAVPYYYAYGYNAPYSSYYSSFTNNNTHYGPRGSLTGLTDPSRRSTTSSTIKMASVTNPKVERREISELRSESRLTQDLRSSNVSSREPINRQELNQRKPVGLTPTESRPAQHTNQNSRLEGRPVGREINSNPSRGSFEPRGESSPTRNPSEANPQRGGNNSKPAPRRN